MAETLQVKKRETRGKRNARRQRAAGLLPAILYGHGQEAVSLSIDSSEIAAAVRHGSRLVDLAGDLNEKALIRDIQWDTFASEMLHVDLTRVTADERIEVEVGIDLRGVAPGTNDGGIVEHLLHEIEVECPAGAIPEKIEVNINSLELGESYSVADLEVPSGVKLLAEPETVVVQCVEPQVELEEEGLETEGAEPELIGRPEGEKEEESES
jgi:large subunit ribosomal protein L25